MLVLSRKVGERIDINGGAAAGGITLVVLEVRGNKVRLGFDADEEKHLINRREVQVAQNAANGGGSVEVLDSNSG